MFSETQCFISTFNFGILLQFSLLRSCHLQIQLSTTHEYSLQESKRISFSPSHLWININLTSSCKPLRTKFWLKSETRGVKGRNTLTFSVQRKKQSNVGLPRPRVKTDSVCRKWKLLPVAVPNPLDAKGPWWVFRGEGLDLNANLILLGIWLRSSPAVRRALFACFRCFFFVQLPACNVP